jgi:hypothetical protein
MKKTALLLTVSLVATSAFVPALAQDASLPATGGSVSLSAGFPEDPYTIEIAPGGANDAADLGNGCVGMVANAPDFSLTYEAGGLPLSLGVVSAGDTTLVVNTPSGDWACDDDSGGDFDPKITFPSPETGRYDIWVGAIGEADAATLVITEIQ